VGKPKKIRKGGFNVEVVDEKTEKKEKEKPGGNRNGTRIEAFSSDAKPEKPLLPRCREKDRTRNQKNPHRPLGGESEKGKRQEVHRSAAPAS